MAEGAFHALERAIVGGLVCGVDEAGRGPWAGPVSAGAVILNPKKVPKGLDDSKKLSAKTREALELEVKAKALAWGVGFAPRRRDRGAEHPARHGSGHALAAASRLHAAIQPEFALVDGNYRFKLPCEVKTVVGGDGKSQSIAAASILAKTARDRLMVEMDERYPGYGFCEYKGYHAEIHVAALRGRWDLARSTAWAGRR